MSADPYESNMKFTVAMVAACPFPGNRGTPSRILQMAEGLEDLGHTVHVVTYHFGADAPKRKIKVHRIPKLIKYSNMAPGPTPTKLLVLDPLLFFKLFQVVRREGIQIIHAHHFEGAIVSYPVRLLTKAKVIYDAHTTLEGELAAYNFWNPTRLRRLVDRVVPRLADHVITVSEELKQFLLQLGIPDGNITCIPTGVNPEEFDNKTPPGGTSETLRISSRIVVIYTGTLQEYQGIDLLLQSMKVVIAQRPDVCLLVIGDSNTEKYRQRTQSLGIAENVLFLGEKPFADIPGLLSLAQIAALPRVECPGIPQKLTNYMAAGKAIVAFEGSAKLIEDRVTGLVVPNRDVLGMAQAILELAGDANLRQQLGRKARERIFGNFDWSTLCRRIQGVYASVLGRTPLGAQKHNVP